MTSETPLQVPANLSHSQKGTLTECGGRYYLERVQRVPNRPTWAGVGGSAAHAATEELDILLYEKGEHVADLDDVRDIFHRCFRQATENEEVRSGFERTEFKATGRASRDFPDKENHLFWNEKGPLWVHSWVLFRDAMGYQIPRLETVTEDGEVVEKLAIELEIRFHVDGLPDEVTTHGFIDRVFHRVNEDGQDEYLVVDLKFGSRTPSSADQLVTYRHGLALGYGIDPRWGSFWMGRQGSSTVPHDLHRFPLEQTMYEFQMAHRQRMAGDFRYHPSNLCGSCGVRDYCPIVGGQFADTITQPWEIDTPISLRPPSERV